MMKEFEKKRVVVMGLGRFGGGIGVTRWLCAQGARVTVTDRADAGALRDSLAKLDGCDVSLRLGGHDDTDLADCDLLVASPAIDKSKSPFLKAAVAQGIPISSEMNLFLERCPARIVGITGSAGKSTTTAMVGAVLDRASSRSDWPNGRVWVGGNIGRSLLDDLAAMKTSDVVVLELSSFQLEDAERIGLSPHIALITNVRENHLDRHGTLTAYAAAKSNIFKYQKASDCLLLPDDAGAENLPGIERVASRVMRFGIDTDSRCAVVPDVEGVKRDRVSLALSLPGAHNLANAAGAMAIVRQLGIPDDVTTAALNDFCGLPHRLAFVAEIDGVRYYNDSKATSPEAAMTSMRAFDAPVVVLLGGSDKGGCFKSLGAFVARNVKAAICYGETGPQVLDAIAGTDHATRVEAECKKTMEDALLGAKVKATRGDVVLLSPACASYDQFANYEKRGEAFCDVVRSWEASAG